MTAISNILFSATGDNLLNYFDSNVFGRAYIFSGMYTLSSGVSHSGQFGLLGLLKAANDGKFNFLEPVKEYARRAKVMKKIFLDNGFKIVYDKDEDQLIADGFYFTISYPGFSGEELVEELLFYGISAISLAITGSDRLEGIRACVSWTDSSQFPVLEKRLQQFKKDHDNSFRAMVEYSTVK
jgi:hypothetical protein